MHFRYRAAAIVCLPLIAVSLFAQSSQQSSSKPTGPAQEAQQTSGSQGPSPEPTGPVAPLQLHNLTPEPHTPTPAEIQAQKEARLRAEITRLATMEANWGPQISHPGMSITLKQIGSRQTPAGTELSYHLIGAGYTPDMRLTLLRWPLNGPVQHVMSGIVVNASGLAVCGIAAPGPSAPTDSAQTAAAAAEATVPSCTKTMKPGTPIVIKATVAKGEPIRVALVSTDHDHGAAASFVPFPLEGQDRGCKLDVILGAENADLVLIKGSGFRQDKTYTFASESYGQKHGIGATIKPDGTFITALLPAIAGHPSGSTVVYYQSATCAPTVSFNWGQGSYKAE